MLQAPNRRFTFKMHSYAPRWFMAPNREHLDCFVHPLGHDSFVTNNYRIVSPVIMYMTIYVFCSTYNRPWRPIEGEQVYLYSFFNLGARWGMGGERHAPSALRPCSLRYYQCCIVRHKYGGSVISGFRRDVDQTVALLGDLVLDRWNMGLIRCPETSVKDYHSTLRNVPEQRRSQIRWIA
jgi:hypothetical protein